MMQDWMLAAAKVAFSLVVLLNFVMLLTWAERKQSALIQDRIGANRASIFGWTLLGLFHPLADALKMITKEDFIPAGANRVVHTVAPFVALFFALISFAAIPFGDQLWVGGRAVALQVIDLNVGLLYVFAAMSMGIYGFVLAGWASNNNFSLLGGLRASSQMIAYEITLGATVIGLIMVFGTVDLQAMVRRQGDLLFGFLPAWGVFYQPLGFLLFTTAAMAETKRAPFDLPEGESEIIGYFVEYSGIKFGMFFMTDFVETVVMAALVVTLFFGGWQFPYLYGDGFHWPGGAQLPLPLNVVSVIQVLAFLVKLAFFCWLFLLVRWTLPRFRYDQLMRLGWQMMLPVSVANVVVTGAVLLALRR
ncbi:MAG: NADH-quinone oxidoreductase subunit H [Acidobacteria bacterium]|nr:NADH-quinone oxidoreductase subunit H [Acidobacteriota bacterium]